MAGSQIVNHLTDALCLIALAYAIRRDDPQQAEKRLAALDDFNIHMLTVRTLLRVIRSTRAAGRDGVLVCSLSPGAEARIIDLYDRVMRQMEAWLAPKVANGR